MKTYAKQNIIFGDSFPIYERGEFLPKALANRPMEPSLIINPCFRGSSFLDF